MKKDGLDIIEDYNKLTPKQVEDGLHGIPKQHNVKHSEHMNEISKKKHFSKQEKARLDNIPDLEFELPKNIESIPESEDNSPVESHKQIVHQHKREVNKDFTKPRQTHEATIVPQNQIINPPMDESGDIDLNKLFSSEVGSESDVVKELFSMENIKVKTELSTNEISIISRLELQATMTQNFYLTKVLKELEILRVSNMRKSRGEFVNSFRGIGDNQSGVSAFSKLGNIFKNDKV
jgi:hypothetical protein